jgi:hypothetical protein
VTRRPDPADEKWSGPTRPYDLVKEFVIATVVVALLVVILAVLFGSPDDKAITLQKWSTAASGDFIATAATELDGTSVTATYGAPYNRSPGAGQKLGPLPLARWGGVREPVDTVNDFVIGPLRAVPNDATLTQALSQWSAAGAAQDQKWAAAYDQALAATTNDEVAAVKPGDYGPVPTLLNRLLQLGQTGALDGALTRSGGFYVGDYTKPLLFLADGSYMAGLAQDQHLSGDQWGMMNETGNFPGQAWLWLYTFWYQISPFNHSGNGDALVWAVMALLSLVFVFVPFIPGLRSIPRRLGIYKLIWRQWYADQPDPIVGSSGLPVPGPTPSEPPAVVGPP